MDEEEARRGSLISVTWQLYVVARDTNHDSRWEGF